MLKAYGFGFFLFIVFTSPVFSQKFEPHLKIVSHDGTVLSANLWHAEGSAKKVPGVIFINSWSLDEYEYLAVAHQLGNAFVIEKAPMSSTLKVRGDATLLLRLKSSDTVAQIYGYLYTISPWGYARLMTHGPHRATGRKNRWQTHEVRLFTTAFDVSVGHRLGVVVDTVDPTYQDEKRPRSLLEWNLRSAQENWLS
jgi:predicted acyl esterase